MKIDGKDLNTYLRHIAHAVAEVQNYGWSNEFCKQNVLEALIRVQKDIFKTVDFFKLTKEELFELGFGKWSDKTPNLFLIPLYLYPCIPDGTELVAIDGERVTKGIDNIDLDARFNCIAYGIEVYHD
jgi:hypothetical protein